MAKAAPTTPVADVARAPTYILSDGVSQRVIQPGQRETLQAVAGRRYKLMRMDAAGAKPVADVIAIADGGTQDGHLRLMTGDHTEIVIRDFFKAPDTSIDIPRPEGDTLTLDRTTSPIARGADGSDLIGMAGTRSGLGLLAQEFAGHFDVLSPDRFATALAWSGALESAAPAAATTLGGILGSAAASAGPAVVLGSSSVAVGVGALAGIGAVVAGVAGASGSSSSSSTTNSNSNTNNTATTDPLAPVIAVETIAGDYRINANEYKAIVGTTDAPGPGLTVSGGTLRVENGNILTVKWAGLEKQVAVVDGKWSVTFPANEMPATDGNYSITVHVKNAAGKEKTEAHELPIDRTASIGIDPVTGDGVISAAELNSGITLTGSTDFEDGRSIAITVGSTKKTVTAASGHWSAAFSKSELPTQSGGVILLDGTDLAGNQAMMLANIIYLTSVSIGSISGGDLLNASEIASGNIAVIGTSRGIEAGGKVTVTWGEVSRIATVASDGAWTVSFTTADVPADGASSIKATVTDAAGISASASHSLTVDRVAPTIAINTIATDDRVNAAEASTDVIITGTTNAVNGATVTVIWNDVSQQGTVTNGAWTVKYLSGQVPGNNSYAVTATVNDAAGNQGSASRTIVVAKDPMLQTISATSGYRIDGASAGDDFAYSIAHLGDVNGDGLSDQIIGLNSASGRIYVVYGHTGSAPVQLSAVGAGTGGFIIEGACGLTNSGSAVSAAGDVNGDGLPDLIVGAPATSSGVGAAYILFGSTSGGFGQTFFDQVGGSGADTMSDGGVVKSLAGGEGDDIIQLAAASVAYGGAGNDTFEIADQAVITALASSFANGGNTAQLAHIDGGSGIDTLKLTGSGLSLDLGSITNRSAGTAVNGLDRLSSIEIIDITGSGDNTLTLSLHDVLDLAGSNIFNNSNGAGFGGSASRHQMIVKSDAADHVILSDQADWLPAGTVTWGGTTYSAYVGLNAYAAIYLEHPIV
ncbi:hypothetical protein LUX29_14895 [Aureimonas altamirensis]|uniref:hypothetical protein n=1 Tax=Aureimonas altamirensis TaxID=370622 RepID=UPI001E596643|nr:hypothetical protein [Aureimonas altamirensis]UHD44337.1 hypothetical protein LUX29_14895 [Aureimonas altamirensis]